MKPNTIFALTALPLLIASSLSSISQANNDTPDTQDHQYKTPAHKYNDASEQQLETALNDAVVEDPSTVNLEAMTISSERPQEAFESIDLIKKDLGIATDGADVLKQTPGVSVTRQGGTASDPILRGLGGTRLNISIDGVPFGGVCNHRMDPATAYVSPGSFDQLILLKGPQSVTNGNNISGAVNFERDAIRYDDIGYTPDEDTLLEFSGLTSNGVIGNATIHMDVTKLDRENYDLHFKKENCRIHAVVTNSSKRDTINGYV
jgi:iron complex outermembrane receptor protein